MIVIPTIMLPRFLIPTKSRVSDRSVTDLGLSVPLAQPDVASTILCPRSRISYFFRVLYNATYLSSDSSEHALSLLNLPDFPQGIEATVPKGVAVAQKFGERSVFTSTGAVDHRELHDCGIIYYPKASLSTLCDDKG